MRPVWSLARLELELWLRSPVYWLGVLALGVYALPALGVWSDVRLVTAHYLIGQLLEESVPIAAFFVLLAAAAAVHRDRAERTEELVQVLPVTTPQLMLARWLGGMAAWLLAGAAVFLAAAVGLVVVEDVPPAWWPFASAYLAHYVPAVAAVFSGGTVLGALIRQPLLLYAVLAAVWAGSVMGTMELALEALRLGQGSVGAWVPLFHPTGVHGFWGTLPSDLVGFYPYQDVLLWQRLFQLGLTVLLLAVAILACGRERDRGDARAARRGARLAGLAVAAAVLAAATGAAAAYRVPDAGREARERLLTPDLRVRAYDVRVAAHPDRGRYDVEATLTVENGGSRQLSPLYLTLDPRCQVRQAGDGIAGWSRPDRLLLELRPRLPLAAGTAASYEVAYTCDYTRDPWRLPVPNAAPSYLPGIAVPYGLASSEPARFQVEVEVPAGFEVVANLPRTGEEPAGEGRRRLRFAGEAFRLAAVGAPYRRTRVAGVDFFYYPLHAVAGARLAQEVGDRVDFLRRYLGDPVPVPGVIPLPAVVEVPRGSRGADRLDEEVVARMASRRYLSWDDPLLDELALSLWWGEGALTAAWPLRPAGAPTAVELGAAQYLTARYHDARGGGDLYSELVRVLEQDLRDPRAFEAGWEVRRRAKLVPFHPLATAVFLTLHDVRQQAGEEGLRQVLRALHRHHLERARVEMAASAAGRLSVPELERVEQSGREVFFISPEDRAAEAERVRHLLEAIRGLPGGDALYARAVERLRLAGADLAPGGGQP